MKRNNSCKLILPSIALNAITLPRVLSIGTLELNYILSLSEEDLNFLKVDINSIKSINDLSFLFSNKNLWNNFQIKTNNFILNTLLFVNKVSDSKVYIEFIALQLPRYTEKEKEFENMIHDINELNMLFIHKNDIATAKYQISLSVQYKGNMKTFELGNSVPVAAKDTKMSLEKINLSCKQYDYFICNLTEMTAIEQFEDFIKFITFLKVKFNSNIIMKIDNCINIINTHDSLIQLNKIYLLTDTFILNAKDALVNFNQHYQTFSTNQTLSQLDEKNINDYFITTIACGGNLSLINSKIAFIIDDNFTKITIIEVPMNTKPIILNYDIKPYPKINHSNVDKVEYYKTFLKIKRDYFESVFYSGLLSHFFFSKGKVKNVDCLYPSFLTGFEILKRILDLEVNDYPYPIANKFYTIRLNRNEVDNYIKKYHLNKKEGKFVLDCINYEKSKMKYYVPLYDYNLHGYFQNNLVRKELKTKGFIDSKGFVNFDPVYRCEMYHKKKKILTRNNSKTAKDILKELEEQNDKKNKKKILHSVSPTIKKLPIENCEVTSKVLQSKCTHKRRSCNNIKHCSYCILSQKAKILDEIEEKKRKKMQLRRYDSN